MLDELLCLFIEGVSWCLMNCIVVHLHNKLLVLVGWLDSYHCEDVCLLPVFFVCVCWDFKIIPVLRSHHAHGSAGSVGCVGFGIQLELIFSPWFWGFMWSCHDQPIFRTIFTWNCYQLVDSSWLEMAHLCWRTYFHGQNAGWEFNKHVEKSEQMIYKLSFFWTFFIFQVLFHEV